MSIKSKNLFTLLQDEENDEYNNNESNNKCNEQKTIDTVEETKVLTSGNNMTVTEKHVMNPSAIEDNMFKQYYGRRVYKNYGNKKHHKPEYKNEFKPVYNRKDKIIVECAFKDTSENILDTNMLNYFRVLGHHKEDQNWDYNSYYDVTRLTKWRHISEFFNTLNIASGETKYTDFDIFIMKNEISPMWEDKENRFGSIISIKIDSLSDGYNLLKLLMIHVANNTLINFSVESWDNVNGLTFSTRKIDNMDNDNSYCVIMKIWLKQNYITINNIDKYFNSSVANIIRKYSIKIKAIRPEY